MRASVVNRLLELAEQNERILLITGDLGFGVLTEFAARLPRQYLNAGVAEQNMSGIACGLAAWRTVAIALLIALALLAVVPWIEAAVAKGNSRLK